MTESRERRHEAISVQCQKHALTLMAGLHSPPYQSRSPSILSTRCPTLASLCLPSPSPRPASPLATPAIIAHSCIAPAPHPSRPPLEYDRTRHPSSVAKRIHPSQSLQIESGSATLSSSRLRIYSPTLPPGRTLHPLPSPTHPAQLQHQPRPRIAPPVSGSTGSVDTQHSSPVHLDISPANTIL